jgi:hypothetical protein
VILDGSVNLWGGSSLFAFINVQCMLDISPSPLPLAALSLFPPLSSPFLFVSPNFFADIILDGFEIANTIEWGACMYSTESDHITVRNCIVHDCRYERERKEKREREKWEEREGEKRERVKD